MSDFLFDGAVGGRLRAGKCDITEGSTMPKRIVVLSTLLLSRLVAAQTPLPDPPFINGGYLPPDETSAQVEDQVAAFLLGDDRAVNVHCVAKLVTGLFHANQSGNAAMAAEVAAEYGDCRHAAYDDWVAFRDALVSAGGVPACLALDVVHGTIENVTYLTLANIFCDGTAPSVEPRIKIATDRVIERHLKSVARIVLGHAARQARCTRTYVGGLEKAGGNPDLVAAAKEMFDECYVTSRFAAEERIRRLYAKNSPACLPAPSALSALGENIAAPWAQVADLYCAQ